jgi:hypothetical protein
VFDSADISIAQVLGLVSFALGVSAFYQKDDRKLKIILVILNLNYTLHFFLLGSVLSTLSTLLAASRTASSIYTSSKWVTLFFVTMAVIFGSLFAVNWWDLLPIFGTVIGTIAIFLFKGIPMRIGFLIGASCWLSNNIIIGSFGGAMLEMTVISVNLFTIYRLYTQAALDTPTATGDTKDGDTKDGDTKDGDTKDSDQR